MQDHLPAHHRQPAEDLLQVVPAGVASHLRIVPAGAEQAAAEKGVVDIDGIHRQDAVQLLQLAAHVLPQQIVQLAHGHHHPGMAQHCGACRSLVQVDLPGLRRIDQQRLALPVGWFGLIKAGVEPVHGHRLPAISLRRARSARLPGGLLAILARRHAMVALKQIAHHSRAGEPLFAGNLLNGFAGG